MAKTVKRISDANPPDKYQTGMPANDVRDVELVINSYEVVRGQKGDFAIIKAHIADTNEEITFRCGGWLVLRQLRDTKSVDFPLQARLTKNGDRWELI